MPRDVEYVYGVISSEEAMSFGPIGIGDRGDDVHTVPYRDLAAAVSDCLYVDYAAIKDRDKEKVVRDLAAHQRVIEEVMDGCTVLPAKFGTMVKDESEVKAILRRGYFALKEALATVQDKVEVEVVATWDLDSVMQEVSREKPIAKLRADIERKGSRLRSVADRIEVGKMVYESLARRRQRYQEDILGALASFAFELQKNVLLDDSFVMNVALLIDKDRQEEFDGKVREVDERLGGVLDFRVIGPLPAYSFSTIEVRPFTCEEIRAARGLLGIDGEEGSLAEAKAAYYRLAQEHHPDVKPGDREAEERFARIVGAYELLTSYCLGEAAARGVTARKKAERCCCSFAPTAVDKAILVTIKRAEGMAKPE